MHAQIRTFTRAMHLQGRRAWAWHDSTSLVRQVEVLGAGLIGTRVAQDYGDPEEREQKVKGP